MENLKRRRLWLLQGIPGSGKSTWIKNHKNFFTKECQVVSRDEVRFNILKDSDEYFSKEKEVWNEFIKQISASLENNIDTIVDATHINESSRGKVLRALKENLKDVEINIIVINTSLDIALQRNAGRSGRALVPESAICRMHSQMTLPTLEEGFDHIYIYEEENGKIKYQIIEKEIN